MPRNEKDLAPKKKLFDIAQNPEADPQDVQGNAQATQRQARKDANNMRKRALRSIAEDPDNE